MGGYQFYLIGEGSTKKLKFFIKSTSIEFTHSNRGTPSNCFLGVGWGEPHSTFFLGGPHQTFFLGGTPHVYEMTYGTSRHFINTFCMFKDARHNTPTHLTRLKDARPNTPTHKAQLKDARPNTPTPFGRFTVPHPRAPYMSAKLLLRVCLHFQYIFVTLRLYGTLPGCALHARCELGLSGLLRV